MAEFIIVLTERSYVSVSLALRQQEKINKKYAIFCCFDMPFSTLRKVLPETGNGLTKQPDYIFYILVKDF